MSDIAIQISQLGKKYKLYKKPIDRIYDAFGLPFLTKDTQDFWALRYIDLEIHRGERVGLIGRNGAGKSTLLKIIIGNVAASEGIVNVNGKVQALMELGTGFHPEFTGRQNIRASLSYHGLSSRQIADKEEDIIDFSELEDFIDQPIKTYSAGMYARLAFSTATSIEPEILIIDEVLGAGDAYFAGKCVDRMKNLTNRSGTTVLFVSHDLSSVLSLCDRAIWIHKGKVIGDGSPLPIVKEYNAMVRLEEETRLRARDLKVSKNHAISLDNLDDLYESVLFHLVVVRDEAVTKVYEIGLLVNGEQVGTIDVGAPMDNLSDQDCFLMDTNGYMDWGAPERDSSGTYRTVRNYSSRYHHAPFQFAVPRDVLAAGTSIEIKIIASTSEKDAISLEVFDGSQYNALGMLQLGYETHIFSVKVPRRSDLLTSSSATDVVVTQESSPVKTSRQSIDEYGDGGARIKAVRIKDQSEREVRVLEVGMEYCVEMEYASDVDLHEPSFVFCVYQPDGSTATQWVADSTSLPLPIPKEGTVSFTVDKLMLGRGSYVASAAIFKKSPAFGVEPESHHVLDRAIHFEVKQTVDDPIDRGLCVHPYEVIIR